MYFMKNESAKDKVLKVLKEAIIKYNIKDNLKILKVYIIICNEYGINENEVFKYKNFNLII